MGQECRHTAVQAEQTQASLPERKAISVSERESRARA